MPSSELRRITMKREYPGKSFRHRNYGVCAEGLANIIKGISTNQRSIDLVAYARPGKNRIKIEVVSNPLSWRQNNMAMHVEGKDLGYLDTTLELVQRLLKQHSLKALYVEVEYDPEDKFD